MPELLDGEMLLSWLFTKSGKPLTSFVYKSTDYSKDGEVVLLQKATVGRGVNIVFLLLIPIVYQAWTDTSPRILLMKIQRLS